jgi:SAM-dependent methyltransferase
MAWDRLRSSYDQVAHRYDDRFRHELDGKPRDRELLDAFAASAADPVVDVGSGPGQIGAYVRARGRRVIGADLSPEMAALAGERLDGAVACDLRALPLATASVGGVIAFYSLIHLRRGELPAGLQELARVLRAGGQLLCSVHEGHGEIVTDEFLGEPVPFAATFFSLEELVDATTGAGLTVTVAEQRSPYPTESSTTRVYVQAER